MCIRDRYKTNDSPKNIKLSSDFDNQLTNNARPSFNKTKTQSEIQKITESQIKNEVSLEQVSNQSCIFKSKNPIHLFGTESALPHSIQYINESSPEEIQKIIDEKMSVLDKYNNLITKPKNYFKERLDQQIYNKKSNNF